MEFFVVLVVITADPDGLAFEMQHEIVTERACRDRIAHLRLRNAPRVQAICADPETAIRFVFTPKGAPS